MTNWVNSFSTWRSLLSEGPEAYLSALAERLKVLDLQTQRAALATIVENEVLKEKLATAQSQESALAGIPFLVKDLYHVAGYKTRAGNSFLSEISAMPTRSNPLVQRLEDDGAVFYGKTHLQEFALGLEGTNAHYGDIPHPHDPERLAGGSSSGSAWAVASGLVPMALGTDTAGSIRVPASWCGLYGIRLRPMDRWIRDGVVPLTPSCDTAGWFTATPEDMVTTIEQLLKPKASSKIGRGIYLEELGVPVDTELRKAYRIWARKFDCVLSSAHHNILRKQIKNVENYYPVLGGHEASLIHREWLDIYKERYDPLVWRRLNTGRNRTQGEINEALQRREAIRDAFAGVFIDYDFVVMPAVHRPAVRPNELDNRLRDHLLRLNAPVSLAALPALTIPIAINGSNLTGGLQIVFRNPYSPVPLEILKCCIG